VMVVTALPVAFAASLAESPMTVAPLVA